ncbi:HTTM domain-containing protein [Aeromicrobium sp. CF3.5]|uniref:HTTM domain-containing protein n=1 Tax=Aeromicrobium sp. CF3.5 TaxID=3373078 RepID=UPI003EE44219
MTDLWWRFSDALGDLRRGFERWMVDERHARRGAAAVRIGTGLAVLGLLLSNFTTRDVWVGQASVWAEPARSISTFPELALLRDVSGDVLSVVYVLTLLAAVAFTLGWRTKAANVITYIGFIAIVAQNPVVGIQGDNLLRLTLLWLLLMRTADHWSLDARRKDKLARGDADAKAYEAEVLPAWISNLLHNTGLAALAIQTMLAYTAAGLGKIAQDIWQNGTALYFTLQLPESRPYPGLSDLFSSSELVLAFVTYLILLTQLFFAPLLLSRYSRPVVIGSAVVVSVLFAVLFAAPWSQLAVVAVTVLFVSESTWEALENRVLDIVDAVADRVDSSTNSVVAGVRDGSRDLVDSVRQRVRR